MGNPPIPDARLIHLAFLAALLVGGLAACSRKQGSFVMICDDRAAIDGLERRAYRYDQSF